MPNVKYLKDPGFLYDLFFLFVTHFNYSSNNSTCIDSEGADKVFYQDFNDEMKEVSDTLLPFFYLREQALCFMTAYYFRDLAANDLASCSVAVVLNLLKTPEIFWEQMVDFYFQELTIEKRKACRESFVEISRVISKSDYPPEVKNSLYSFFCILNRQCSNLHAICGWLSRLSQSDMNNNVKIFLIFTSGLTMEW